MKIAEALMLRSDMQKKLASLRERVGKNALVQQGDEPHEDPAALIAEAFGVLRELERIVFRINQSNAVSRLPDGRTLTEAIARRDTLAAEHSLLQHARESSQSQTSRYSVSEIKWVSVLKVVALQRQSDDIAKALRELNASIQETNWKIELEE